MVCSSLDGEARRDLASGCAPSTSTALQNLLRVSSGKFHQDSEVMDPSWHNRAPDIQRKAQKCNLRPEMT